MDKHLAAAGIRHDEAEAPRRVVELDRAGQLHVRRRLKNRVLLENYYLPGDLEAQVGAFVDRYNHRRYHESLGNLTPADVYFGRHHAIIESRRKVK